MWFGYFNIVRDFIVGIKFDFIVYVYFINLKIEKV